MRSLGLVACSLFVLACGGERTDIQIVVYAPSDYGGDPEAEKPDTVKLFVGMDESDGEEAIAPEGFTRDEARSGAYWIFEYESEAMPISDTDPAEFRFVLDERKELGIVVAVGYTQGRPTSSVTLFHVAKKGGDFTRYPLGLNASANALDPDLRSRLNQLELWGERGQTCVHVENQREDIADKTHRTAFIVRDEADLDCDGFLDTDPAECSPNVFMDSRPPELDEISCVTEAHGSGCRLGGPACLDGRAPSSGSCDPSRYCTTAQVCEQCSNATSTLDCVRDLQQLGAGLINGLAITCELYFTYEANNPGAQLTVCPTRATFTVPTSGRACMEVRGATRMSMGFGDTLEWTGLQATLSTEGCEVEVTPSGTLDGVEIVKRGALLVVDLEDRRGLAIPAMFKLIPTAISMGTDPSVACATLPTRCFPSSVDLPAETAACLAETPP